MHILIVEDDAGITLVLRQKLSVLRSAFPNAVLTFATTLDEARRAIATIPWPDLVILDLTLPDSSWVNTLAMVDEFAARSALFIVTGQPEEKVRSVFSNPEIEVHHKTPELFSGNFFIETIARVLHRRAEKEYGRLHAKIRLMRELLGPDASTIPPP